MDNDNDFAAVWEATNELRFVSRLPTGRHTMEVGVGVAGAALGGLAGTRKILQQKWRNQYGIAKWRDVPEVAE